MTNQEIFEDKLAYHKWLQELTFSEFQAIMDMLDAARREGFHEGVNDGYYDGPA